MKSTFNYQPIDNIITLEQTKENVINRLKSITEIDKIFYFTEGEYLVLKDVLSTEVQSLGLLLKLLMYLHHKLLKQEQKKWKSTTIYTLWTTNLLFLVIQEQKKL
jgi:hypothetical protein